MSLNLCFKNPSSSFSPWLLTVHANFQVIPLLQFCKHTWAFRVVVTGEDDEFFWLWAGSAQLSDLDAPIRNFLPLLKSPRLLSCFLWYPRLPLRGSSSGSKLPSLGSLSGVLLCSHSSLVYTCMSHACRFIAEKYVLSAYYVPGIVPALERM